MDPNGLVWQRANIHDGAVHGYKEGNNDENDLQKYGEDQEVKANTRIPYASTLLQTSDMPAPELPSDINMPTPEGIETMAQQGSVPIDFDFVKTSDNDLDTDMSDDFMSDEAEKIEVSEDVPKDFHFIHISTSEGELMKVREEEEASTLIETMPGTEKFVPLNFGFVHLQNEQGDDIMRYM